MRTSIRTVAEIVDTSNRLRGWQERAGGSLAG